MTSLWRKFPSGNKLTVKNFYSKTQDGIIVNNEWWGATQVPLTLTLNKTSLAVDPQQLSLTLTTTTPFVGTIGKGSMILVGKQQSVRLGRLLTTGKSTRAISTKTFNLSTGTNLTLNKVSVLLSTKTPTISLGYTSSLGKNTLNISYKNENISVGTIAQLNKLVYTIGNRPLTTRLGFNTITGKSTLNTSTHVLSVHLGFNGTTVPQAIPTTPHIFNVSGGFVGDVGLYNLLVAGKTLRVINTKLIYPSEQIFSMTERSSNFVMKPRKTFYTLTDK